MKNEAQDWRQFLWLAVLAAAGLATSLSLACAVPLGAFAALGALTLERRSAYSMIVLAVIVNQLIGFMVLHYPRDAATFAWTAAFLLVGVTATLAASWIKERCADLNSSLAAAATFLAAFVCYEGTFFSVTLLSGDGVFDYTPRIVWRVFEVNALAFVGLMFVHRVAVASGLLRPQASKLKAKTA